MINRAGIELLKSFEGFRAYPYRDQGGVFTIGFGHTRGVNALTTPITEDEAEAYLIQDIQNAESSVRKLASCPLNENQYAALVSLVYNVGQGPLLGTLGKYLDQDDYTNAAEQFLRWDHIGKQVSNGLLSRREAERQLFLTPVINLN